MADEKRPPPEPPWAKPAAPTKPVSAAPVRPPAKAVPDPKTVPRIQAPDAVGVFTKPDRSLDGNTKFVGPPTRPKKDPGVVLVATNSYVAVTDGPRKGAEYPLSSEKILFGRDPGCDVVVEDEGASRRHAQIYRKNDRWYLRDLGSTNGTHDLNGLLRGAERLLSDRDVFRIGEWEFTFSDPASARR